MADHHAAELDPNVAPTHQEIVEDFSFGTVLVAVVLGLGATAAGIICGIVLANN